MVVMLDTDGVGGGSTAIVDLVLCIRIQYETRTRRKFLSVTLVGLENVHSPPNMPIHNIWI